MAQIAKRAIYEEHVVYNYNVRPKRKKTKKMRKKKNVFALMFALLILGLYGYFVCPYNFENYIRPIYFNRFLNRNLKTDIKIKPTLDYIYNSSILGSNLRVNKPENETLASLTTVYELSDTKAKLLELFKQYPRLSPSVYVWEYEKGAGLEINSDELYPSASIIKLPIACEFMRYLDRQSKVENPTTLNSEMEFTEFFRTEGSGILKTTHANRNYSLNSLAKIMITHSDNSATNMILYQIGGVLGFNRAMRNLGLKKISMNSWLADLEGTNKISAREISKVLYNIDNPKYINPKYKSVLKDYLVNTKNTHLLKEKLPSDAIVLHKTGDIGSMLGDSGIVYTNNGKKYIVTILVKRPRNDYGAKLLIQDASLLIYNDIIKL